MTYFDVFSGLALILFVFIALGVLIIVISNRLEYMSLSADDKHLVSQIRRMNSEQLRNFMIDLDEGRPVPISDYVYNYAMNRAVRFKMTEKE